MKNFYLTSLLSGFRMLLLNLTYLFIPVYLQDRGFSGLEIGVVSSIFAVTAIIFSPAIGLLTDRMQVRTLISAGAVLMALFLGAMDYTGLFAAIFIVFLIGGIGNNMHEVSIMSMILKSTPPEKASSRFGLYFMIAVPFACAAIAAGGAIVERFDYSMLFNASAAAYLILPFVAIPIVHDTRFSPVEFYKRDFARRDVLIFSLAIFLFSTHLGAEQTCWGLYLKKNLGFDLTLTGIFAGAVLFFYPLSAWISGRWFDRTGDVNALTKYGLLLSGIGSTALFLTDPHLVFFFRMLHELGDGMLGIFLYIGIYRLFPQERMGGLSATVASVIILGRFLGAIIYSPIGEAYGYHVPMIISGVFTFLLIPFFVREIRKFSFSGVR